MIEYRTGEELLAGFECKTREQELERVILALMDQVEQLHVRFLYQSLSDGIEDKGIFCSCADAYRMGHAVIKNN